MKKILRKKNEKNFEKKKMKKKSLRKKMKKILRKKNEKNFEKKNNKLKNKFNRYNIKKNQLKNPEKTVEFADENYKCMKVYLNIWARELSH